MGSLSNLYISQSYQSLIHLGNDTTASTSLVELQDGFGNSLGIAVNTNGDLRLDGELSVQNLTVTGAVAIDTYFSSSTPPYINSIQPYFTDTVYVTGSYTTGSFPPSIADVKVGWTGNGINVTNGLVTAVSQSVNGYYITMAGQFPQQQQPYTFTGGVSAPVTIDGDLIISENLIVSGTFDIEGKVVVNDNVRVNGNLEVSGSQRNTGSLFVSNEISSSTINGIGNVTAFSQSLFAEFTNIENYTSSLRAAFTASGVNTIFTNDITASNIEVRNNLNVVGTLFASKVVTLIESSSIIYSSGSNILGDATNDTQTLIGSVIMSGSASLTGSMGISNNLIVGGNGNFGGSGSFIGNLTATGNISSSTISGIGNVTTYSQSVDARLDFLEGPFSTSVDLRLDQLESFSSSLVNDFVNTAEFNAYTQSTSNLINTKLDSASFNAYTQSTNTRIDTLASFTGSYATTGSNYFIGNQTFSGSVEGSVVALTISAQTASMNLLSANFFTITLASGSNTHISAFNATDGQTISLKVTQPTGAFGTVTFSPNVKFPQAFPYIATPSGSAVDIISFQTYDPSFIYGVAVNTMR